MKQIIILIAIVLTNSISFSQNDSSDQQKFENLIKEGDSLVEAGKIKNL